ncbi:baseplate assembly protein [Pseudoalteromonas sp. T1lg65]|uniref:baseplate assembly protein n=1 Tax=Pseudoalteromonas sp. T1lg65 TaxID=2077101 RepID=UPI003F79C9DB
MNNAIDLTRLAAPNVIEALSYDEIYQDMEQQLKAAEPQYQLLPSDPAIKLLELFAYREVMLRQRVNDAAQSVMLAYAQGTDLDHLGELLGIKRKLDESDQRYRTRIPLSLESHSMAGTSGAYQYHAFSASTKVKDVFVESSNPGIVDVYILPEQQVSDVEALRLSVLRYLNDEDVRPLTDLVRVHLVQPELYRIEATVFFNSGINTERVKADINQALSDFIRKHYLLGKEIPHSGIIDALHQGGVRKVQLLSPTTDLLMTAKTAAVCHDIKLHFPQG